MKKLIILTALSLLPMVTEAAGNRDLHCYAKGAELVFHTFMHGALAVGSYTVLNGERADLPNKSQSAEGTLTFYNQGMIFEVEDASADAPLRFTLLKQLFGPPTVIENGFCIEE